MLKLFFYTAFIMVALAYACKKDIRHLTPPVNNNNNHYRFLALGDSYTIGQSVAEKERFPEQTKARLTASGKYIDNVVYIAATGWTTTDLENAIDQQSPQGPFEIVTLLIGVNDQNKQRDTTGYSDRFTRLLQKAVQLAGNKRDHVFVLSIPDYSVTPYGSIDDTMFIRKQIDLFNSINLRISNAYNISYTNITPVSREALNDPSLIASDGLHPSGKMYEKWAALLEPAVKKVLK
jgi:lysophospholipase L1-like esterase